MVNTSFDISSFSCQYERKLADFMTAPSAFRQQPEVSIRSERRKHLQNMLTSFQIISICFPTLHLLLGFRRLKEKDYSLVVLPKQTSPN